jgi:hypothetical protein
VPVNTHTAESRIPEWSCTPRNSFARLDFFVTGANCCYEFGPKVIFMTQMRRKSSESHYKAEEMWSDQIVNAKARLLFARWQEGRKGPGGKMYSCSAKTQYEFADPDSPQTLSQWFQLTTKP